MNYQPLVSVIIATRNREKYIKKAIESVIDQSYNNIELIIVDGGSTDNTKKIVQPYLKDGRVHYICKKDRSPAEGRNNGIKISQGKYIAILDSDDFWCNQLKLEKQVKFLEEHSDYVLVSGGAIAVDKTGKECYKVMAPETDEEIREIMLSDCLFPHGTVVFRKNDWQRAGGYDKRSEIGLSEDWNLWLKFGEYGKFYSFQEYFLYYLQGEQSRTSNLSERNMRFNLELIIKYRKKYPNFWKAFLLELGCYFCSVFPRPKWAHSLFIIPRIKNIFFRRQIYTKSKQ